ncbi:MAG: hypothetical protein JNM22_02810 [Saprospiraceae bacterium]|nr:hypothetical protein [Saprospiraceae bacterium]
MKKLISLQDFGAHKVDVTFSQQLFGGAADKKVKNSTSGNQPTQVPNAPNCTDDVTVTVTNYEDGSSSTVTTTETCCSN